MGTHNWDIVPFFESVSFKKRYVRSNSQLQLQLLSHSKSQLQFQLCCFFSLSSVQSSHDVLVICNIIEQLLLRDSFEFHSSSLLETELVFHKL